MIASENSSENRIETPVVYYSIIGVLALVLTSVLYLYGPAVTDWWLVFHRAGSSWLAPYQGGFHFAYPPWMAAILTPFHFIEIYLSRAIWGGLTLLACAFTNKALKGNLISFILFFMSVPTLSLLGNGQVDGVAILGLGLILLDSPYSKIVGTILILAKPQLFIFAIPFLLLGSKDWFQICVGVAAFLGLSFLIWGWWPLSMFEMAQSLNADANVSIWPYGIPIGLALLVWAYKSDNIALGALATLCFVPYIALHSYAGYTIILFTQLPRRWAIVAYVVLIILGGLVIKYVSVNV